MRIVFIFFLLTGLLVFHKTHLKAQDGYVQLQHVPAPFYPYAPFTDYPDRFREISIIGRSQPIHYAYLSIVGDNGVNYSSTISYNPTLEYKIIVPSWVIQNMFDNLKISGTQTSVSNRSLLPGIYTMTIYFKSHGTDGSEFPPIYTQEYVWDFEIPEYTRSLSVSFSGGPITNLVDVQNQLRTQIWSNYYFDGWVMLKSFTGPGGTICTANKKSIDFIKEGSITGPLILSGDNWAPVFENPNISCNCDCNPYEYLVSGDYEMCFELLKYNGYPFDPPIIDCQTFVVEEPEYNLYADNSAIEICSFEDIPQLLANSISVKSTVPLNGYRIGAIVTGPSGYNCPTEEINQVAFDAAAPTPLSLSDLQQMFHQDVQCFGGLAPDPYTGCLANGTYNIEFKLYPPNEFNAVTLSFSSNPSVEMIIDNPEPSFEINTLLTNDQIVNLSDLLSPGNISVSFNINVPFEDFELSAEIMGDNGIRIQSATGIIFDQAVPNSFQDLTYNGLQQLLGEGNTLISGTLLTDEDLYQGGMPAGNYTLCFNLKNNLGQEIELITGEPCVTFIVSDVPSEFSIQTYINNEYICNVPEIYQRNNLQLEITSNVPFADYRLFADINGNGLNCRTLLHSPLEIDGKANIPTLITSEFEFEEILGIDRTVCSEFVSKGDVYESCLEEGTYQICFELQNAEGNVVPWQDGSRPCHEIIVEKGEMLEPPVIIAPEFGERIDNAGNFQNIIFIWEPVPFAPQSVTYTLKIVEMLDSTWLPARAMQAATTPAFFEEELDPLVTSFHYGIDEPELIPGRYYAFQVIANDPVNSVVFENNGASEVYFFKYGQAETTEPFTQQTEILDNEDFFTRNIIPVPEIPEKVFHNKKVSGVYQYHFRHRSGGGPLADTRVQLKVVYAHYPQATSVADVKNMQAGQRYTQWNDVSDQFEDGDRILDNSYTDATGTFQLYATVVYEEGVPAFGYHKNMKTSSGEQLPGIVLKAAVITHNNPYFLFDSRYALLHDDEDDYIGLTATPRDYSANFHFTCSGKIHNAPAQYQNMQGQIPKGTPIVNYDVFLLREYIPMGIPNKEGDKYKHNGETRNGKEIISKGSTDQNGYVFFDNLLLSTSGNDTYYVVAMPKTNDKTNFKIPEKAFRFNGNLTGITTNNITQVEKNKTAIYNHQYESITISKAIGGDMGMPEVYGKVADEMAKADGPGIVGADVWFNYTLPTGSSQNLNQSSTIQLDPGYLYLGSGTRFGTGYPNGEYNIVIHPGLTAEKSFSTYNLHLVASKWGYSYDYKKVTELKLNERRRVDFIISPSSKVKGRVKLQNGGGVAANVGLKNHRTITAQPENKVQPDHSKPYIFEIKAPVGPSKVQATPPNNFAASYFSVEKDIVILDPSKFTDVGTLELPIRQHSIKIQVAREGTNPILPVPGARIEIKYKENAHFVTDNNGVVEYKFKAPDVSNLQILVKGPENEDWEPVMWNNDGTLSNIEANKDVTILIRLKKAGRIRGRVTYGQEDNLQPVDIAAVSIDLGNGYPLRTYTNANGEYELRNVPMNRNFLVTAAKGRSQFVGDKRYAYLRTTIVEDFNFNLTVFNGMVITELLHLPIEVHELQLTNDGAKIEGAYYDLTSLTPKDWKIQNENLMLTFRTEIVPSKTEFNDEGVPLALPITGKIPTNATSLDWKYKDKVHYIQQPVEGVFTVDDDGTGWARIDGKMQLILMQYDLSSAQLNLGGKDILIGNGSGRNQTERILFTSIGKKPTSFFNVMDGEGNNLNYCLYGFKSIADKRTSLVKEDKSLTLDTRLQTNLDYVPENQKNLNINIGKVNVSEKNVDPVNGKYPFEFALGNWNLQAHKWVLGEGGIRVDSCILKTRTKDMTIDNFYITYTKLGDGKPVIQVGELLIAESVPVAVDGNTYFEYNLSRKSWCVDVRPDQMSTSGSNPVAFASKIYNVNAFDSSDEIKTSTFTYFANNTMDAQMLGNQSVHVYDVANFGARELSISADKIVFEGSLALQIPGMGSQSNSLSILKSTKKRIHQGKEVHEAMAKIKPVTGKFNANSIETELLAQGQKFAPGIFESKARLKLAGADNQFASNLKKNTNYVECVLDPNQKFNFSEGKALNQLQGGLKVFNNPLDHIDLPQEQMQELNDLAKDVKTLQTYIRSFDIPSEQMDQLMETAYENTEQFSSMLWDIENTSGQRIDETMELASSYKAFADKISGFDIDQEAKDFLISKAGKIGDVAENTWNDMDLKGKLEGATGATSDMGFIVNNEWVANEQEIGVKNVPSGFGGVGLTYNIEKKRMEGHMSFEQDFGSATVAGDASIIIGGSGWYFIATGQFLLDALEIEGMAGIMFGDHAMEQEMEDMFKRVSFYYRHLGKMPPDYPERLSGFYFNAGAAMPVPSPGSFKANFAVVKVEFITRVGGDSRMGMAFTSDANSYAIGQGVFVEAWLEVAAGFIVCAEIDLGASVGVDVAGQYISNGEWWAEGTGYVKVEGRVEVGVGTCFGNCDGPLCGSTHKSGSLGADATIHLGSDYKKISIKKK